jgi:hypothetical protein
MSALNDLKTGISFTNFKGDVRQPHNYAMGRVPAGYSRWYTASIYAMDIERIIQELKTSLSFVSTLPDETFLSNHGTNAEDYIMYHQGYFLDLVHQLKDKICQLTKALITYDGDYSEKDEKSAELGKILKDGTAQKIPQLLKFLKEWNADDPNQKEGPITIVLKKRTLYHHFKNPLPNTDSYFKAKTDRFLLSPSFVPYLSDYGKQMVTERGRQSLQSWQANTVTKISTTLKAIEENVEGISKSLVSYYRLTHTADLGKRTIIRYTNLDRLIEVSDSGYRVDTIQQPMRGILEILAEALPFALGQEFSALYVIGSIPRGDFMFGLSDINFVVILKNNIPELETLVQRFIDGPANALNIPIDTKIYSEAEFMTPEHAKERFICRTDGLLLSGTNLLRKEKEQRVCFKLAWMLNKDYRDYLASLKSVLDDTSRTLTQRELILMVRELGKRTYRLGFSQVIGNNVRYTSYFHEMRHLNNFYYPQNRGFNDSTFKFFTAHPFVTREALASIRDNIDAKLIPLYDAIDKVVNGVSAK